MLRLSEQALSRHGRQIMDRLVYRWVGLSQYVGMGTAVPFNELWIGTSKPVHRPTVLIYGLAGVSKSLGTILSHKIGRAVLISVYHIVPVNW